MRAVVSVIGKDMVGILAKVSAECENANMNVIEVSQTLLQDMFAMIMLIDITKEIQRWPILRLIWRMWENRVD